MIHTARVKHLRSLTSPVPHVWRAGDRDRDRADSVRCLVSIVQEHRPMPGWCRPGGTRQCVLSLTARPNCPQSPPPPDQSPGCSLYRYIPCIAPDRVRSGAFSLYGGHVQCSSQEATSYDKIFAQSQPSWPTRLGSAQVHIRPMTNPGAHRAISHPTVLRPGPDTFLVLSQSPFVQADRALCTIQS